MNRQPDEIDIQIADKLKTCRKLSNLTQGSVAEKLGVTFQQLQKYEASKNRVSASRLFKLSKILNVPISFFFDDVKQEDYLSISEDVKLLNSDYDNSLPNEEKEENIKKVNHLKMFIEFMNLPDMDEKKRILKDIQTLNNSLKKPQ